MNMRSIRGKKIGTLALTITIIIINSIMSGCGCISSKETFKQSNAQLKIDNSDDNEMVCEREDTSSELNDNDFIEWKQINDKWHCYNKDGMIQERWVKYKGLWYYVDSNGAIENGWIYKNNNWYYTNTEGVMQTGFVNVDDVTYYFASNGVLQANTTIGKPEWMINDNSISFEYKLLRSDDYTISTEIYDANNKPIRTCNWNYKKQDEKELKQYVSICGILGEMNNGDYIVASVSSTKDNKLKVESEKMSVIENSHMDIDTSQIEIKGEKDENDDNYCNLKLSAEENFDKGIYVIYGQDLYDEKNIFIGTSYCNGKTNTLEYKKVSSEFINGNVSSIKLAKIFDVKINDNLSGVCKVQVSDKFN